MSEVEDLIERWPLIKEFQLPERSNIVVVGAYKGLAMEALAKLYPTCRIVGFEPQSWAWEEASERLKSYFNVRIFNIGVGVENALLDMGEWHTDAASFVNNGLNTRLHGAAYVGEADTMLTMTEFEYIDLMIMNIEGYEYQLIPYLRSIGWLRKIERLAVQWHIFPEHEYDYNNLNKHIDDLIVVDDYLLRHDERPTWTYFVKDLG